MAETKRRFIIRFGLPLLLIGTAVGVVAIVLAIPGGTPQNQAERALDPPDKVVVEVDGVTIRQKDLARGISQNLFGVTRQKAEKQRLVQVVRNALIRHFLDTNGIAVPEDAVTRDLNQIRSNPSAGGCPYCAPAATFDEMLRINFYTEDDVKDEIRNRLGLAQYLELYWDTEGKKSGRPRNDVLNEQLNAILLITGSQMNTAVRNWENSRQRAGK